MHKFYVMGTEHTLCLCGGSVEGEGEGQELVKTVKLCINVEGFDSCGV